MLERGGVLPRLRTEPVRAAFHPIADLKRATVAGYEVVLRIGEDGPAAPRTWSQVAHVQQVGPIEAELVAAALATRERLPADRFLAVSVSAAAVLSPELQEVFASAGLLERVVVVVSDDGESEDAMGVHQALQAVRDAGATVAVDESASGYASLKHVLRLRPEFVRIGADFVVEIDRDLAKAAVVETFGTLASRIDSWMIAGGVPGRPELNTLRRMGVPLAMGPFFGEPADEMGELPAEAARAIAASDPAPAGERTVGPLVEARPSLHYGASLEEIADAFLEDPRHDVIALVDERMRPLALAERSALLRGEPYERPVTRVTAASPLRAVARRAAARPLIERFHPLVVCDRRGVYIGVLRVEQLLDALAQE